MSWVKTGTISATPTNNKTDATPTSIAASTSQAPPTQLQNTPPTEHKTTPTKVCQPKEPIYHEIIESKQSIIHESPLKRIEPLLANNLPSNVIVTSDTTDTKEGGKENKLSPSLKKKQSVPLIPNALLTTVANDNADLPQFSGKRCHSFNIRRPLQVKLAPPSLGEESIPNSPSFYTANPLAGTMPMTNDESQSKQGFKEHLNEIGVTNPVQHHHVVSNWIKGTQRIWDGSTLPLQPKPHPQNRPLPTSQSVQNRLGQLPPVKSSFETDQSNSFKDHVYEDPDVLLKSTLLQRKTTEPILLNPILQTHSHSLRSRSQSHTAAVRRPYITREHKSSSGNTLYATDV